MDMFSTDANNPSSMQGMIAPPNASSDGFGAQQRPHNGVFHPQGPSALRLDSVIFSELARPNSAPPLVGSGIGGEPISSPLDPDDPESRVRADPNYVRYYYDYRGQNPRLPPPISSHFLNSSANPNVISASFADLNTKFTATSSGKGALSSGLLTSSGNIPDDGNDSTFADLNLEDEYSKSFSMHSGDLMNGDASLNKFSHSEDGIFNGSQGKRDSMRDRVQVDFLSNSANLYSSMLNPGVSSTNGQNTNGIQFNGSEHSGDEFFSSDFPELEAAFADTTISTPSAQIGDDVVRGTNSSSGSDQHPRMHASPRLYPAVPPTQSLPANTYSNVSGSMNAFGFDQFGHYSPLAAPLHGLTGLTSSAFPSHLMIHHSSSNRNILSGPMDNIGSTLPTDTSSLSSSGSDPEVLPSASTTQTISLEFSSLLDRDPGSKGTMNKDSTQFSVSPLLSSALDAKNASLVEKSISEPISSLDSSMVSDGLSHPFHVYFPTSFSSIPSFTPFESNSDQNTASMFGPMNVLGNPTGSSVGQLSFSMPVQQMFPSNGGSSQPPMYFMPNQGSFPMDNRLPPSFPSNQFSNNVPYNTVAQGNTQLPIHERGSNGSFTLGDSNRGWGRGSFAGAGRSARGRGGARRGMNSAAPHGALRTNSLPSITKDEPPPLIGFNQVPSMNVGFPPAVQDRNRSSPASNAPYRNRSQPWVHGGDSPVVSALMNQFRVEETRTWRLEDLRNHIPEFARDQHGSRFIQQRLETGTTEEKEMVFSEAFEVCDELMVDVFGNYVIQKLLEFGLDSHRTLLADRISGNAFTLSVHTYGCRVVQKALEVLKPPLQGLLVQNLHSRVLTLVEDQNGNHVIQKCIECLSSNDVQFVIDAFVGQVSRMSLHAYGCRVIQRILENCSPEQKDTILEEILFSIREMSTDQYGNYVVQHVLENGDQGLVSNIVLTLKPVVLCLSQQKYASNVVEKCFLYGSEKDRHVILEVLLSSPSLQLEIGDISADPNLPDSCLSMMVRDQYGNFVVQKFLDAATPQQRDVLVGAVLPYLHVLRKYTYGRHVAAKLEKEERAMSSRP